MSTDISRSIYRPSVSRYVDRHIGRVSVDISADTSVDYRAICRPIYWSRGAQNTRDPTSFWYYDWQKPRVKKKQLQKHINRKYSSQVPLKGCIFWECCQDMITCFDIANARIWKVFLQLCISMQTVVHVGALSVQSINKKCTSVVKTLVEDVVLSRNKSCSVVYSFDLLHRNAPTCSFLNST